MASRLFGPFSSLASHEGGKPGSPTTAPASAPLMAAMVSVSPPQLAASATTEARAQLEGLWQEPQP